MIYKPDTYHSNKFLRLRLISDEEVVRDIMLHCPKVKLEKYFNKDNLFFRGNSIYDEGYFNVKEENCAEVFEYKGKRYAVFNHTGQKHKILWWKWVDELQHCKPICMDATEYYHLYEVLPSIHDQCIKSYIRFKWQDDADEGVRKTVVRFKDDSREFHVVFFPESEDARIEVRNKNRAYQGKYRSIEQIHNATNMIILDAIRYWYRQRGEALPYAA